MQPACEDIEIWPFKALWARQIECRKCPQYSGGECVRLSTEWNYLGISLPDDWESRVPVKFPWEKAVSQRTLWRRKFLELYGARCACCGEMQVEFLTLDHIKGDGKDHRYFHSSKTPSQDGNGLGVLKDAVLKFDKKRYRVLCYNCHMARTHYGSCPHRRRIDAKKGVHSEDDTSEASTDCD